MLWQGGRMRALLLLLLCLTAACSDRPVDDIAAAPETAQIARDPVIARALHDPLMSDPDLASRNEANAALGSPDSNALPVLPASSADASAAREAMRLELLASGPIPALPPLPGEDDDEEAKVPPPPIKPLGPMAPPADLLAALGLPATCAAKLKEDFAIAASMPAAAALPPQGMVMQAGGADAAGCRLRIVRYVSAAPLIDVLQYHHARATRAGLTARRQAEPAAMIIAEAKGSERLVVEVRRAAHGMTGVTLLYRAP